MPVPSVKESFAGAINEVTVGATKAQGGSRSRTAAFGGDTGLPMLGFEGKYPNKPLLALEVINGSIKGWPPEVAKHLSGVADDVGKWAAQCEKWGADAVCLRLEGAHPDEGGKSADACADDVKKALQGCGLPLMIWGVDVPEVDNVILPKCSQAAKGENCLLGTVKEKNYRTLAASCLADGHKIIAESPCDVNLAKQVNILLQDAGVSLKDIVIYPTTGALGFGMIYIYSMMERARLAAVGGDKLMQQPILLTVGEEACRVKEAKMPESEAPSWGPVKARAPLWEAATAIGLLEAGGAAFVFRNPEALAQVKQAVEALWPK